MEYHNRILMDRVADIGADLKAREEKRRILEQVFDECIMEPIVLLIVLQTIIPPLFRMIDQERCTKRVGETCTESHP